MQITNFVLSEPDDDGDVNYEIEADAVNNSGHDVLMLTKRCFFFNRQGAAVDDTKDKEQVRIEPGEAFALVPCRGYFSASHTGPDRDDITARLHMTLYARELHPLGTCKLPADHTQTMQLDACLKSAYLEPDLKIVVSRRKPDFDGDVRMSAAALVRRLDGVRVGGVTLRGDLVDADGAVLDSEETEVSLQAHAQELVDLRLSMMRAGRLRNATVRFSLMVFVPVQEQVCEAVSMPAL